MISNPLYENDRNNALSATTAFRFRPRAALCVALVLIALVVGGCVSGPAFTAAPKPPPGYALIYVYRQGGARPGAIVHFNVWNLWRPTNLPHGGYYAFYATPGETTLKLVDDGFWIINDPRVNYNVLAAKVRVEAGRTYYFRFTNGWAPTHLELVDPSRGEKQIAGCRLVGPALDPHEMMVNAKRDESERMNAPKNRAAILGRLRSYRLGVTTVGDFLHDIGEPGPPSIPTFANGHYGASIWRAFPVQLSDYTRSLVMEKAYSVFEFPRRPKVFCRAGATPNDPPILAGCFLVGYSGGPLAYVEFFDNKLVSVQHVIDPQDR